MTSLLPSRPPNVKTKKGTVHRVTTEVLGTYKTVCGRMVQGERTRRFVTCRSCWRLR